MSERRETRHATHKRTKRVKTKWARFGSVPACPDYAQRKERGMRWTKRKVAGHGYLVENMGIGQSGFEARLDEGNRAHACGFALGRRARHDGVRDSGRRDYSGIIRYVRIIKG